MVLSLIIFKAFDTHYSRFFYTDLKQDMGYFYNFELKNNTLCKVLHSSSNNRPPTVNNFQHLCNEPLLFFPSLLHLLYRSRTRYGPLSLLPPLRVALVVVVIFISSYAPWVFMQMVYFSPASFSAKMPRKEKCVCVCLCVCRGIYSVLLCRMDMRAVRGSCWWKLHVISRIHDPFH